MGDKMFSPLKQFLFVCIVALSVLKCHGFSYTYVSSFGFYRDQYMQKRRHHASLRMMPEGPEVRSYVDSINLALHASKKWQLSNICVLSGRYSKTLPTNFETVSDFLPVDLLSVQSKGKFIFFRFERFALCCTCGLTGGWTSDPIRFSRVKLTFECESDGTNKDLYFFDMRNYGTIKFSIDRSELDSKLSKLGFCWIGDAPSFEQFLTVAKKVKPEKPVAVFLMDQSKTAGIGNYILSEVLYRAQIHPWARCSSVSEETWRSLYHEIVDVIEKSYKSQSPIVQGNNVTCFRFQVYAQKICPRGLKVTRETGPHKRSIHWVPEVQKLCAPPDLSR